MIQVDLSPATYGFYSGDIDQNGFIDLVDVVLVFNSASAFETGYILTDVNGDLITDLTDLIISFNNSANFVKVEKP